MRNATQEIKPLCAAFLLIVLAGCAAFAPPAAAPEPEPVAAPASPPAAAAVPPPAPAPALAPPLATPRVEIALLVDTGSPAHAAIADEIEATLPPRRYRVTRFEGAGEATELVALRDRPVTVVAVGVEAVRTARAVLPSKPLVFCQVPQHEQVLEAGSAWGVQTLPPLALQLKSWQAVDPSLRTIALIVSASGAALADEARRAASSLSTDLLVETSRSDRETLYLFRRIAASVDGLWLLPDNDALSPQALRELLSYAASRGIGVLTFNEALLARGALLTATAVPADVAAAVAEVVAHVAEGDTEQLPAMSPLSAAALTVNVEAAAALGLPPVAVQRWVAREAD